MADTKPDRPPIPATTADLARQIEALIAGVHDPEVAYGPNADPYGKCVEAMARAGYMAHELVARELGVTGFQHSMSSLLVVGMLRGIEGPYMLVDTSKELYPQYDLVGDVEEFLRKDGVRTWLADQAAEKLAEFDAGPEFHEWVGDDGEQVKMRVVSEKVEAHWRALVADRPDTPTEAVPDA